VGLALTAEGLGSSETRTIEAVASAPPRAEQLSPIAHWIAPPDIPVRFDARYFAVEATDGVEPRPDGVEAARAWWMSPRALLEGWRDERHKLYWPTYFTMHAIAKCSSVADLLDLRIRTREPDEDEMGRLPRSTFWQG
jgi:hypothetical protein